MPGLYVIDQGKRSANNIVVRGLKVTGAYTTSTSRGFSIQGPGTNISLLGNETDGTRSSGIGVWGVSFNTDPTDYQHLFDIVLDGNLIRRACDGGYDECITVANGVHNIRVSNNEITAPGDTALGGEGIDFKEGVFGGVVSGNHIHDMIKVAIYGLVRVLVDWAGVVPLWLGALVLAALLAVWQCSRRRHRRV